MARKETLVCKPCGYQVVVTDIGGAVIECYECGTELLSRAKSAAKAPPKKAAKKPPPKKAGARKPAPKKAAQKKK